MLFSEVLGQSSLKESFCQMVESERMPHALLFLGAEGCGKLALALALAQYILCEDRQPQNPCGRCRNCMKTAKSVHPDLHFSFPTIGTNVKSDQFLPEWRKAIAENPYMNANQWLQSIGAENKQGNINKEECLNIIRKLNLKTYESTYKILILWLPEYLGKEGNRLLKLIEEPPENTIFLLVAENQELILNTILSRCQTVKVNQLEDEAIIEGLLEKNTPLEKAQAIALLADGNFNEALKLLTQEENDNANMFLDWMRKCYIGNGIELVKWVEQFASLGRENQKQFLRYALHFMREYMILKMAGKEEIRLKDKELTTAKNLIKVINFDQIGRITQLFDECSYYIERNANPKILFLDTSIQINQILRVKR